MIWSFLILLFLPVSYENSKIIQSDLILGKWEVISLGEGEDMEQPVDLFITFFSDGKCDVEYENKSLGFIKWKLNGNILSMMMEEGTDIIQINFDKDLMIWNQEGEITTLKKVH